MSFHIKSQCEIVRRITGIILPLFISPSRMLQSADEIHGTWLAGTSLKSVEGLWLECV
jgi:hypothetical protein